MNKLLKIGMGAVVLTCLVAGAASAGQNAGATGRLDWINANGTPQTGAGNRNTNDCVPKLGMSAIGLTRLRGADVQLYVNGPGGVLPPSWQYNSGGCNDSGQLFGEGYKTSGAQAAADSVYNAWTTSPSVPDRKSVV